MAETVALIAIDWGTTNRRAWAFTRGGRVVDQRGDAAGLLAVAKGDFAQSFAAFVAPWRSGRQVPVIMCGMVGSKLGWIEAPYLFLPLDLQQLSKGLCRVPNVDAVWVVPGVCDDRDAEPDVMRGEECQILGAILREGLSDAILLLPGTHSKWAIVKDRSLIRFRTYLTGEIFSMLRTSGTIAQLMTPGAPDSEAFRRGAARGADVGSALLHSLFCVRTLGLFERMKPEALASYLSGLLIGAEIADGLSWAIEQASGAPVIAVGSRQLIANYAIAAEIRDTVMTAIESDEVLPPTLFSIAEKAGLLSLT
jgi:2-dehydro-3-deoxygalactonokinase